MQVILPQPVINTWTLDSHQFYGRQLPVQPSQCSGSLKPVRRHVSYIERRSWASTARRTSLLSASGVLCPAYQSSSRACATSTYRGRSYCSVSSCNTSRPASRSCLSWICSLRSRGKPRTSMVSSNGHNIPCHISAFVMRTYCDSLCSRIAVM